MNIETKIERKDPNPEKRAANWREPEMVRMVRRDALKGTLRTAN